MSPLNLNARLLSRRKSFVGWELILSLVPFVPDTFSIAAFQDDGEAALDDPLAKSSDHRRASSLLPSSTWAICNPERFNPMRYKEAI
jgi:hypothetical protein